MARGDEIQVTRGKEINGRGWDSRGRIQGAGGGSGSGARWCALGACSRWPVASLISSRTLNASAPEHRPLCSRWVRVFSSRIRQDKGAGAAGRSFHVPTLSQQLLIAGKRTYKRPAAHSARRQNPWPALPGAQRFNHPKLGLVISVQQRLGWLVLQALLTTFIALVFYFWWDFCKYWCMFLFSLFLKWTDPYVFSRILMFSLEICRMRSWFFCFVLYITVVAV